MRLGSCFLVHSRAAFLLDSVGRKFSRVLGNESIVKNTYRRVDAHIARLRLRRGATLVYFAEDFALTALLRAGSTSIARRVGDEEKEERSEKEEKKEEKKKRDEPRSNGRRLGRRDG